MGRSFFLFLIFFVFSFVGLSQSAKELDSLKALLRDGERDTTQLNLLNQIAWQSRVVNAEEVKTYGQRALNLAMEIDWDKGKIKAYNNLAVHQLLVGDLDSAIALTFKAEEVANMSNNQPALTSIHNNLGIFYRRKGYLQLSLHHYYQSLELKEYLEREQEVWVTKINIANLQMSLRNYEKARGILKELDASENDLGELEISHSLSAVYHYLDSGELSLQYAKRVEELADNRPDWLNKSYDNQGLYYMNIDSLNKAEMYLRKAIVLSRENGFRSAQANNYSNLSRVYFNRDDWVASEQFLDSAVAIAEEIGLFANLTYMYEYQAQVRAKQGRFDEAYQYEIKLRELKDSLTSVERLKSVEETSIIYETAEKERLLGKQEVQIALQNGQIGRQNLIILIGGLLVAIVGLIAWFLYNKKQQRDLSERRIALVKERLATSKAERKKMSEELHDVVGNSIDVVVGGLRSLEAPIPDLQDFIKTLENTSDRIKDISYDLNPPVYEGKLSQGIAALIHRFKRLRTFDIELFVHPKGLLDRFPESIGKEIFLVLQEAFINVRKHGKAKTVTLDFTESDTGVNLMFEDDGAGFNPNEHRSSGGIVNMRQRCAAIKAKFRLDSTPGSGTVINVELEPIGNG